MVGKPIDPVQQMVDSIMEKFDEVFIIQESINKDYQALNDRMEAIETYLKNPKKIII